MKPLGSPNREAEPLSQEPGQEASNCPEHEVETL